MYITNIDTLSALIDRLISENIKLYFFEKDKSTKNIKHQELVIKEIKMRLNSFLSSTIGLKKYEYISEIRTWNKPDDIIETIEELVYNDIHSGEGDRDNLKEALSDNPSVNKFQRNHKRMRKANETRALNKNKIDEQFKNLVENENRVKVERKK
jgi:hypothetical protein